MYIIRLMIILLLSVFVVGCATHNNISKNSNKSSAVVYSSDDNTTKVKSDDSSEELIIVDDGSKSEEKANVKINGPGNNIPKSELKKSVLLKQKLHKCGVKYVPWADRHAKDLILMPKILSVCTKNKLEVKSYILHSSSVQRKKGYLVNNTHLFLPFNWNEKEIKSALNHLPKK